MKTLKIMKNPLKIVKNCTIPAGHLLLIATVYQVNEEAGQWRVRITGNCFKHNKHLHFQTVTVESVDLPIYVDVVVRMHCWISLMSLGSAHPSTLIGLFGKSVLSKHCLWLPTSEKQCNSQSCKIRLCICLRPFTLQRMVQNVKPHYENITPRLVCSLW